MPASGHSALSVRYAEAGLRRPDNARRRCPQKKCERQRVGTGSEPSRHGWARRAPTAQAFCEHPPDRAGAMDTSPEIPETSSSTNSAGSRADWPRAEPGGGGGVETAHR